MDFDLLIFLDLDLMSIFQLPKFIEMVVFIFFSLWRDLVHKHVFMDIVFHKKYLFLFRLRLKLRLVLDIRLSVGTFGRDMKKP